MRLMFSYRQKIVHDPAQCSDMLSVIPRFKDVKGPDGTATFLHSYCCFIYTHLLHKAAKTQEHLDSIEERRQPYLLAVGTARSRIHAFYIVVDKVATPCKAAGSLCAFDELFKAHFVFGTAYCESLRNMYTFIQMTVYKIDIGKVKESPRVAELRARFGQ
ncbi:hypothetical protein SRHO_G00131750 [Serrasalmus rhombeus]